MFKINAGKASLLAVIVSLGFTSFFLLRLITTLVFADRPETVTICHAAGQEGTTQFVTLTLPYDSVYGQAGHFNEGGTSLAGHEQDYLGPCEESSPSPSPSLSPSPSPSPSLSPSPSSTPTESSSPSPTPTEEASPTPTPEVLGDVCDNIDGIQTSVPDGLHLDASGRNCVAFELGGAPTPPPVTGQVLGATALGKTGKAEENIFLAFFTLGSILTAAGVRRLAAPKR